MEDVIILPCKQPIVTINDSSSEISQTSTVSTATIVTSSVPTSMAGHMMYTSPHTVMYASSPSAMQVSHGQGQDTGETTLDYSRLRWDTGAVPQVFLTAPSGTMQIPVSAVQLHPMVIGQQLSSSSSNLTELQVVNLDTTQNTKND